MSKALRADLDEISTKMFAEIKQDLNVKHDAEVVRILIKKMHKILEGSRISKKEVLTSEEKSHLDAWAKERNDLSHLEEPALKDLLLQENQHVWPWLPMKVDQSVDYLLMQKRN